MASAGDERSAADVEPLRVEELAILPVFPLPRVVFFPGTELPLHLFEPRYRKMVEACVSEGPRAMAVALLADGWEPHYEGRPAIHTIAGAGRIVFHEKKSDGTHDIVLTGTGRVRIHELPTDALPYRRGRCEALSDPPDGKVPANDISALWACATQVAGRVQRQHPEFALGTSPDAPPGEMADTIADRLIADHRMRQEILEALDPAERVRLVTDHVGELLARITPHGQLS